MAVSENIQEVKVVLGLTKGTQTIPNCKRDATAQELYDLGQAVGSLHEQDVKKVTKVTETLIG